MVKNIKNPCDENFHTWAPLSIKTKCNAEFPIFVTNKFFRLGPIILAYFANDEANGA
jgi:hypothetical protein